MTPRPSLPSGVWFKSENSPCPFCLPLFPPTPVSEDGFLLSSDGLPETTVKLPENRQQMVASAATKAAQSIFDQLVDLSGILSYHFLLSPFLLHGKVPKRTLISLFLPISF